MYSLAETQGSEEWLKIFNYLFCQTLFFGIYNISAYDKTKSPKQQPSEETQMASNSELMIITGIKVKYLSEKINEYGTNHFFAVLDETPVKELIELEDMTSQFGNIITNTT